MSRRSSVDAVKRICAEYQILVSEIWTYTTSFDQVRFTMVHRDADAPVVKVPEKAAKPAPPVRQAQGRPDKVEGPSRVHPRRKLPPRAGRRSPRAAKTNKPKAKAKPAATLRKLKSPRHSRAGQGEAEERREEAPLTVPFLRLTRDRRGFENTFLMHADRPGDRPRLLYWYRTAPGIALGRLPLDEDAIRTIEDQHPDIDFDWPAILALAEVMTPEDEAPARGQPHSAPRTPPARSRSTTAAIAQPETESAEEVVEPQHSCAAQSTSLRQRRASSLHRR